jgi:cell wall-associated NlpC family hydrolase
VNTLLRQLALAAPRCLDPVFWLDYSGAADVPLLEAAQIAAFNDHVQRALALPDPLDLPDTLPAGDIRARIAHAAPQTRPLYGGDGAPVAPERLDELLASVRVLEQVQFGLVTAAAAAHALPADALLTSEPLAFQTNLVQETVVDVGWPVALAAVSADGRWCFCLTPLYWGWLPRAAVAAASRAEAQAYRRAAAADFLITTASRGLVGTTHGGVMPQMGTRLPLLDESAAAWCVRLPAAHDGKLREITGTVSRAAGTFHRGWLPPTPRTLLTAAFALLGEPYAWGGMRLDLYGRDCSRFVQDIYALIGVALPRNSGQQRQVSAPRLDLTPDMPLAERRALIATSARPGDLLWLPGHIMLYLGALDGDPYVIHAAGGPNMAVIVSTLDLYAGTPNGSLLERIRSVVYPAPPGG